MNSQPPLNLLRVAAITSVLTMSMVVRADTILTFDTVAPPQFHNAAIPQSFGDNASSSSSGIIVTGIGTPDINLTWGATNNPANASSPSQRWDYYSIASEDFWRLAQLNQSRVNDAHELTFTPANAARVVIKSFNFHGYYPSVLNPTNSLYYQERFTYRWDVLDTNLTSLAGATYSFLSNSNKDHQVSINYTGSNGQPLILRLTRIASTLGGTGAINDPIQVEGDPADIGIDDITFSEETSNTDPVVNVTAPINGETNHAPAFFYRATILDGFSRQAVVNTVRLRLDGDLLSPTIGKTGLVTTVTFAAGGLIRSGSTHTYSLTFEDNAGSPASYTNQTAFTVQYYSSYEWRFLNGDLSTDLGDGTMNYVAGDAGTTFGTTDGSTVPHISGSPAKYMHVPGFTSDADGYQLTFNSSGPNVGTNAYLNRYSLMFDVMIPSPWPVDYIVPFFNTDPFNLNDADFYLYGTGEIGIGGPGYSSPGALTPDAWARLIVVVDLKANTLTYYVNGTSVKSGPATGLGGRWALYSNQDAGPDLLLFNEGDSGGVYTHELYVSSVAFTDRVLSAGEAATLGGPNANGILVRSFSPQPALNLQSAGGNATISWPAGHVGYALEQADNLMAPQWKPVAGITNNAVTLVPSASAKFFRLVQ